MPEFDDDDFQDDDQDEKFVQLSAKDLRALRKKAKLADDLSPKQAAYERELGFLKAGINTEDAKMKYFVKAYDGDLSPEAIKSAAIEAGLMAPPPEQVDPEELRQHQQMANASNGADSGAQQPSILEEIEKAGSPDEIMQILQKAGAPTVWNRPED